MSLDAGQLIDSVTAIAKTCMYIFANVSVIVSCNF